MKKLYLICVICMLAIAFPACSKKNSNKAPAEKEKTVDLGENDGEAKDADANRPKKARANDRNANADDGKKDKDKKDKDKKDNAGDDNDKKDAPADKKDAAPSKEDKPAPAADNADNKDKKEDGFDFTDEDAKPVPRVPKPRAGLSIEKLINIRELREQTGYSGALSESYLLGQVAEPRYNSMRLAPDDSSKLGFSIQVWKPGNESAASKRFNDLFSQSFGGQKIRGVATDAFTASHHKLHELAFYDKSKRSVVFISCSDDICTVEQMKSIAQIIQRRL